jgi:ATP-binding cassette, subfamily B (MDR/TAP), member 1
MLLAVAVVSTLAIGASSPIFYFFLGDIINSFGSQDSEAEGRENLYKSLYLAAGTLVAGMVAYTSWAVIGERQAIRCRQEYFKSLMNQELAWFDLQNETELVNKFELDCMIYQLAVGEKIMTLITIVAMLVTGIGLALYTGWMLTLVIMAYLPFLIIAYTKNFSAKVRIAKEEGAIFQEIDSHAQEVFNSIKLVKQMNAEAYEISTQQGLLDKIKANYKSLAVQFIIWSSLAVLSFDLGMAVGYWYGSECVFGSSLCPGHLATRQYTVGSIVKVFCALFLPAVSLNQLSPSL